MCCNRFENWANGLSLILLLLMLCGVISMDCRTKAALWWASVALRPPHLPTPGGSAWQPLDHEQRGCWETHKEGPSLIAASKVPNPAWGQLRALAKNLSATCVDPVDLEDSYYDHACLDPGGVDADVLSQDKSDYMGRKMSRSLFRDSNAVPQRHLRRSSFFFLSEWGKKTLMIYLSHLLLMPTCKTSKKDNTNRPRAHRHTPTCIRIHSHQAAGVPRLATGDTFAFGTLSWRPGRDLLLRFNIRRGVSVCGGGVFSRGACISLRLPGFWAKQQQWPACMCSSLLMPC